MVGRCVNGRSLSRLLTCEAVICETCFLLKRKYLIEAVFEMIEVGAIAIAFNLKEELSNIRTLMERYESVPMSFADACLVRMSEQSGVETLAPIKFL